MGSSYDILADLYCLIMLLPVTKKDYLITRPKAIQSYDSIVSSKKVKTVQKHTNPVIHTNMAFFQSVQGKVNTNPQNHNGPSNKKGCICHYLC
jgi:hypothetical protein